MIRVTFSDALNISNTSSYSTHPKVVLSKGEHIYIIWHESVGIYGSRTSATPEKRSSIMYRVSHDSGQSFGGIKKLYDFFTPMSFPATVEASKAGRVFAAWRDIEGEKPDPTIIFTRTADIDGSSEEFENLRRMNREDEKTFKHSDDVQGRAYSPDKDQKMLARRGRWLHSMAGPSPSLVVSDHHVYILWLGVRDLLSDQASDYSDRIHVECEVIFRASHNAGDTFDDPVKLGQFTLRDQPVHTEMNLKAIDGKVYATWHQLGRGDYSGKTLLRRSNDGGTTFDDPIVLGGTRYRGQPETSQAYLCDVAVDESDAGSSRDELFATWFALEQKTTDPIDFMPRFFGGNTSLHFAKIIFSNNGFDFSNQTRIAEGTRGKSDSFIRVHGDNVYVFYGRYSRSDAVCMKSSSNRGATFGPEVIIRGTDPPQDGISFGGIGVQVLCQKNKLFAAWHKGLRRDEDENPRKPSLPKSVVMFSVSDDAGITFSEPSMISVSRERRSALPSFAVSGNKIHMAWCEGSDDAPDVWFRLGVSS